MAESLWLDEDQYNCSVCLDLMTDPVTLPCGHSYCRSCIIDSWDKEQFNKTECPQCRHRFPKRPELNKNTMLAEIMEKLRNTKLQGPLPAARCSAQPGDVECDFCTDGKLKAVKSCLECRASYCETHLQTHLDVPALRKHKLIDAIEIPMCPKHDRLLEAFCRTDNTCICLSCVMKEHKGHDTVSAAEERDRKQVTMRANKNKVVEKREGKKKELDELRKTSTAHTQSTWQLVEVTRLVFSSLINSLEKSCFQTIEKITTLENAYQDRAADLQEQLEVEIAMLMEQEDGLDKLLQTEDNIHFLQNFQKIPNPSEAKELPRHTLEPAVSFSRVSSMLSEFKIKLEIFCQQELDQMFTQLHIKVGDQVRVKTSVTTPKFNWGHTISHASVGVVQSVNDETVIVDFPGHKSWKGILSEMECVTAEEHVQQRNIEVGDRVRVKPSVTCPKRSWGTVTHQSVGVVKKLSGEALIVDFQEHAGWMGLISEMEIVS